MTNGCIDKTKTKKSPEGPRYVAHLFIVPVTSTSFMKHSMLSGRSEQLALISFFSFSHSW